MSVDVLGPEWHLSEKGWNVVTENGAIKERSHVLKKALDTDIKDIGKPILASQLVKDKTLKIVLQIQKIRNIAAPKANEDSQAAPRMLKLILTDGETNVQALELSTIQQISRDRTAPGSKVLINGAKVASGYLLLNSSCCSLLGGKVPELYERWEVAKSVLHNRQSRSDGPPPWVNFGCKIQAGGTEDNFKSLDTKHEINKESSEFEQQRQGAIAEATSGAVKKVFGGRVKQQVVAPQNTNNFRRNNESKKNLKGRIQGPREVEDAPQKPSEKVSLFDFLETKLPVNELPQKSTEKHGNKPEYAQSYNRNSQKNKLNDNNKPNNAPRFTNSMGANTQNRFDNRRDNYPAFPKNIETPKDLFRTNDPSNSNQVIKSNDYARNPSRSNDSARNKSRSNESNWNQSRSNDSRKPSRVNDATRDQQRANESSRNQFRSSDYSREQRNASPRSESHRTNHQKKTDTGIENSMNEISSNMNRMSIGNNLFASKILRRQLNINLPTNKNSDTLNENTRLESMAVGDHCLAKYWEDQKVYDAVITGVTERTYVVIFKGYGNTEEVLKTDCFPLNNHTKYGTQEYAGNTMEFHRGKRVSNRN